jgi:glycosyltransferase involved in cell wall biosynthesis
MSQDPLHVLCIEPRFPGRLGGVADWLVRRRGYRCWFYCNSADSQDRWPASAGRGLEIVQFSVGGVAREPSVHWTRQLERGLCYAYGCWEVLDARRPRPVDLVLGRSAGLGSTLFAPVYLPGVPIVNLFDYYYHAHANDLADAARPETPVEYFHWRQSANAMDLLDLENGVTPWTPTAWQRDLYPPEFHADFQVQFDGVDARRFDRSDARPRRGKRVVAGREIPPDTCVVSFVARSLDRTRGFDRFLKLANRLLRERPDVLCIVAGDPVVQRALDVEFHNQDYRGSLLSQDPPPDPQRLWFLDATPPTAVAELLAASDLHVYPSRTYAASRSLVDAMAAGCVILATDTDPVREFITHDRTGLLVPAEDPEVLSRAALTAIADPAAFRPLGAAAAKAVRERYDREVTLPKLAMWFDQLVADAR